MGGIQEFLMVGEIPFINLLYIETFTLHIPMGITVMVVMVDLETMVDFGHTLRMCMHFPTHITLTGEALMDMGTTTTTMETMDIMETITIMEDSLEETMEGTVLQLEG